MIDHEGYKKISNKWSLSASYKTKNLPNLSEVKNQISNLNFEEELKVL